MISLPSELQQLETAEDFFEHFQIPYDVAALNRLRLHVLQRFHDYLAKAEEQPANDEERDALLRAYLARSYEDFLKSDPLTERVFKVLQDAEKPREEKESGSVFIPLDAIGNVPPQE
jgi:Nitrogen fixation protein NifW.